MHFEKTLNIQMNGVNYTALVEGYLEKDEHDVDVKHQTFTSVVLEDEQNNVVDSSHEDYDDLMEYVENQSYDEMEYSTQDDSDYVVSANYDPQYWNNEE